MLCQTKRYTGKHLTQDCFRRSLVYETWCISCQEKELEKIEIEAGNDKKRKGELTKNMKLHKYIGETNRSCFERGWEHLNDFENLSTKSHMLKHAVEVHKDEEASSLKFGMKVISYSKSSFERQILESTEIQRNRNHSLLNSRSEYNRCAVPRIICKLGDKTFKKNEQEMNRDLEREELQVQKIRELKKERNRLRGESNRLHAKAPVPKRRKMESGEYELMEEEKVEHLP